MLDFCEQLTIDSAASTESNILAMREVDFSDRDILSIILVAAFRNYIIRIADGLGVELNPSDEYPPELLRAFGVDEKQAYVTLYPDRSTRTFLSTEVSNRRYVRPSHDCAPSQICWIDTTPPTKARERFTRAREELVRASSGRLSRLSEAFALRPDALAITVEYLRVVDLGGSGLCSRMEALIGLVVASTLWSPYMGVYYAQRLLQTGLAESGITDIVRKRDGNSLGRREREVAAFAERLTRVPSGMTRSDIEALRGTGFDDRDIVAIVAAVSLQNFLCCVVNGVGLQTGQELLPAVALDCFSAFMRQPSNVRTN